MKIIYIIARWLNKISYIFTIKNLNRLSNFQQISSNDNIIRAVVSADGPMAIVLSGRTHRYSLRRVQ